MKTEIQFSHFISLFGCLFVGFLKIYFNLLCSTWHTHRKPVTIHVNNNQSNDGEWNEKRKRNLTQFHNCARFNLLLFYFILLLLLLLYLNVQNRNVQQQSTDHSWITLMLWVATCVRYTVYGTSYVLDGSSTCLFSTRMLHHYLYGVSCVICLSRSLMRPLLALRGA